MTTTNSRHALTRSRLLLLAGLMVLSTVLFVAGVALERSSAASGGSAAPASPVEPAATAGEAAPEGSEAREAQEHQETAPAAAPEGGEGSAAHEAAEQNRVFGIDVESPWVLAGVVAGSLLLIVALFVFGERLLPLILLISVAATVFDLREVVYQLGQARYLIAALAAGVVLSRLATALVAGLVWREGRQHGHPSVAP